ncbi:DUF4190 domain-containing protein [Peterkaempfera sp. SMS 1(5)a]|uniref:DUF4190 domain-containing protein n=1 Tax=Peterkaempfera podocarpi TaxID=3232308 RepID=UPI00366A8BE8
MDTQESGTDGSTTVGAPTGPAPHTGTPEGTAAAAQPWNPWAPPDPSLPTASPPSGKAAAPADGSWGPWGPYGGMPGWPQPAPPPGVNGFAIASLVLGFTCLVPLSAGFGIAALGQIRRTGQRGRGLARAGLALSTVWAVAWVTLLVVAFATVPDLHTPGARPPGTTSVFNLQTGDCFDAPTGTMVSYVTVLPCSKPHEREVFGQARIDGNDLSSFPGKQSVLEQSSKGCQDLADRYIMDSWAYPATLAIHYYYPKDASQWWKDPHSTCFFVDDNGKRSGSVRRDYTNLNGAQLDYLDSTRDHNDALNQEPGFEPSQDLHAYHVWAAQVADATELEAQQLEAGTWSPKVRGPIADLVREIRKSLPYWRQAATARDDHAERLALSKASLHDGYTEAKKVRGALGLATGDPDDNGGTGGTLGQET